MTPGYFEKVLIPSWSSKNGHQEMHAGTIVTVKVSPPHCKFLLLPVRSCCCQFVPAAASSFLLLPVPVCNCQILSLIS